MKCMTKYLRLWQIDKEKNITNRIVLFYLLSIKLIFTDELSFQSDSSLYQKVLAHRQTIAM